MANETQPNQLQISKDIKQSTYTRLIPHIYLFVYLLLEKEKESILLKLGLVLAFSSILVELRSIVYPAFWETQRVLKKFIFAGLIYSFVNIWIVLNLFVMMHMKPHDLLDNIICWIFLRCFILCAMYFTCVHVFDKEPFSYFRRNRNVSTNSNRNRSSFFANPEVIYFEPSHFAMLNWAFIRNIVQVAADKPSIFRTISIFLCFISGLVIFIGYFYTLRGFDRISKRLSHALIWFPIFTVVFSLIPVFRSKGPDYTERARSFEFIFGLFAVPMVLMAIYIICLLILDKDPLSYFKKEKDINDGSMDSSVCHVV